MLDFNQLRYFLSAYDARSFTGAGRILGLSQPSVSVAISKLEEQLGSRLFERGKTGLSPTPLGKDLYQRSSDLLARMDQLEIQLTRRPTAQLRLYCQPDILLSDFKLSLAGMVRARPGLTLHFCNEIEQCDLALVSKECALASHTFHPAFTVGYGVALPPLHPLTACKAITAADLTDLPLIGRPYCPGADAMMRAFLNEETAESVSSTGPQVIANAVHDHQLLELVAAGLGAAVVPMSHQTSMHGVTVIPLAPGLAEDRTVGIAARKTALASETAALLLQFLSV
jgi:DNA-binding transcriptional LysR family regulator